MRKKNEAMRSEQVLGEILLRHISQNADYFVHKVSASDSDFINQVETDGENYERQCSIQNASDIFRYGLILREQQEHIKENTEFVHNLEDTVDHLEKRIKKIEKKLKKKSQEVNTLKKKSCRQKAKNKKYHQQLKQHTKIIRVLAAGSGISRLSDDLKQIQKKCTDRIEMKPNHICRKKKDQNVVYDAEYKEII